MKWSPVIQDASYKAGSAQDARRRADILRCKWQTGSWGHARPNVWEQLPIISYCWEGGRSRQCPLDGPGQCKYPLGRWCRLSRTWPPGRRVLNYSSLGLGGQMCAHVYLIPVNRHHGRGIKVLFGSSDRKVIIPPLHNSKPGRRVKYNYLNSIIVFVIAAINWRRGGGVLVSAAEERTGRRGPSSCAGSETEPHSSCLCWTIWWTMWQRHPSISISPLITGLIFTHQETC